MCPALSPPLPCLFSSPCPSPPVSLSLQDQQHQCLLGTGSPVLLGPNVRCQELLGTDGRKQPGKSAQTVSPHREKGDTNDRSLRHDRNWRRLRDWLKDVWVSHVS